MFQDKLNNVARTAPFEKNRRSPGAIGIVVLIFTWLWAAGWHVGVPAVAEEPYKIKHADPLSEPWRISRFPELKGKGLRCLVEDKASNIWFGVRDGAIQYDGYEWVHHGVAQGLPGVDVFSLVTRSDGSLVAATGQGLYEKRGSLWQRIFPQNPSDSFAISSVIADSTDTLWACTTFGLVKITSTDSTLFTSESYAAVMADDQVFDRVVVLPEQCLPVERMDRGAGLHLWGNKVMEMGEDSPARLAGLKLGDEILAIDDRELDSEANLVSALKQMEGNRLRLKVLRPKSGKIDNLTILTNEVTGRFRSPSIHSVIEDSQNRIWVGTTFGKVLMSSDQGENWKTWRKKDGLELGNSPRPLESGDGTIWVFSAGIDRNIGRFDGQKWTSEGLGMNGGKSFATPAVESGDGTIWVACRNKILSRIGGRWTEHDTRDLKIPGDGHRMLCASDGALWIVGYDQEAIRVSLSPNEFLSIDGLKYQFTEPSGSQWFTVAKGVNKSGVVRQVGSKAIFYGVEDGLIDKPDSVIGTPSGEVFAIGSHESVAALSVFNGSTWKLQKFPKFSKGFSRRGCFVDRDGNIWIGSKGSKTPEQVGGIVARIEGVWQHFLPPLAPQHCTSIGQLADGRMVFGRAYGIRVFNGEHWSSLNFGLSENKEFYGATFTSDGTLWATTRANGVWRYKDNQWIGFDIDDGLLSNECSAIHADSNDNIWVSTRDGICKYDGVNFSRVELPEHLGRKSIRAGVGKSIWLDGVLRYTPDDAPPRIALTEESLRVDPGSTAWVSWTGVDKWNRTSVDQLRWSWRIDGGDWSKYSSQTQFSIEGLSVGKHQFELKAVDGEGNPSEQTKTASLTIVPPYWMRPWFLSLSTLVLGLFVYQTTRLIQRGVALRTSNQQLTHAREQLADRFAEKSAQFRAVCDNSPIGIFVTDPKNQLNYFNDYLGKLANISKAADQPQWFERIHPEDREQVENAWFRAVENKAALRCSGRFLHHDKSVHWFDAAANRIEFDGEFLGYVGAVENVTEKILAGERLKTSNQQLQSTLDQLEQAQEQMIRQARLNALGQMAAGVVHDINNALTPIMTYAQMLNRDSALAGEHAKYLDLICLGLDDTSKTVRRLKHFYKQSHNLRSLDHLDLFELASQTVEFTRPKWQDDARTERKLIEVSVEGSARPTVRGDASQLRSVLTNLIFNSVEAIPGSGKVVVRIGKVGNAAVVEIIDDGIGMTNDQLQRCTEPFFTSKATGSGLGLSECHGIVRQHGGELEVESCFGNGTTIRLKIPCVPQPLESHSGEAGQVHAATGLPAPHLPMSTENGSRIHQLKSKHVLCVDDDQAVLASTSALFKAMQIRVSTACDGPAAIRVMEKESIDLVFCDQGLPGMDGLTVVKKVKSRWPNVPVVIVSGWTLPEDDHDGFEPDGFMEKPFSQEELMGILNAHLSTKSSTDESPVEQG